MFRFFASGRVLGVLLLGLSLGVASPAHASDDWLGRDKTLHFSISLGLGAAGYGVAASLLDEPLPRAAVGLGFAMFLGIGKEIWDATGRGDASGRDLTWDLVGAATGVLFAFAIDRLFHRLRGHAGPVMAFGVGS